MKKENKILAQQRRAAERKKQAHRKLLEPFCKFGIPALVLVVIIGIMITHPFAKKDSKKEADQNKVTAYNTDTALTVKDGDTINIDFVGSIDGVEFQGGNTFGSGADLTIGSHTYIDDFEEQLIGSHPGDKVDVYATFPEGFRNQDLAGKEALFKVTVNGIYR